MQAGDTAAGTKATRAGRRARRLHVCQSPRGAHIDRSANQSPGPPARTRSHPLAPARTRRCPHERPQRGRGRQERVFG